MPVVTAVDADILESGVQLPDVTGFTTTFTVSSTKYASNKTAGKKRTLTGSEEAAGSADGLWDDDNPLPNFFEQGDSTTLDFYFTNTQYVSIPVLITSMEFTTNIDDQEPIDWSFDWENNNTWTWTL